jgi:predicted DNA-binding transcriptional regulator AlpA
MPNQTSLIDGAPVASVRIDEIIGREIAIGAASDRRRVVGVAKRSAMPSGQKTGPAYPPRAMRAEQAADYLSMSRSMWLKLVDEGKMPKPVKIGAMTTWDRYDIDDAFEDLKRGDGEPSENTVHKRLRELADERSKSQRS